MCEDAAEEAAGSEMPSDREIERLKDAYRGYAADGRVADRQSLTNRGNRMILQERWAVISGLLKSIGWVPLGDRRILDVGTGGGGELARLISLGANPKRCCGVDLMAERIEEARRLYPLIDFRVGNAEELDFPAAEFDLVFMSTVLSSILDDSLRLAIAHEVARVLKPGGALLWYDLRYPSPANRDVRPVSRRELRRLFPGLGGSLRSVTLLPPLARRLGGTTTTVYRILASIPVLRSHLIGLLVKPDAR